MLSIIIPTSDDPDGLTSTLRSLKLCHSEAGNVEIIVANDGAHESIRTVCESYKAKVVDIVPNQGSYNARNRGAEAAEGKYLGFIDAGVVVHEQWISRALESLHRGQYIAGPVLHPPPPHRSAVIDFQDTFSFRVGDYLRTNHFAPTANLVVCRDLFRKLGGFDRRLRSGGDYEFGCRVHDAGIEQLMDDRRIVYHPYRTLKELLRKQQRTTMGLRWLERLHPTRFAKARLSSYSMARRMLPPNPMKLYSLYSNRCASATWSKYVGVYGIFYLLQVADIITRLQPMSSPDQYEWSSFRASKESPLETGSMPP